MERDEYHFRPIRNLDLCENKENCLSSSKKSAKEFNFRPIKNLDLSSYKCPSSNKKTEFHFRPIKNMDLSCYKCSSSSKKSEAKFRISSTTEKEARKLQKEGEAVQSKKRKKALLTDSDTKSVKRRTLLPVKVCSTPKAKKKLFQSSKIKTFKSSPKQLSSRKARTPISIRSPKQCLVRSIPKPTATNLNGSTMTISEESIILTTTPVRPKPSSTLLHSRVKSADTPSNLNSSSAEFQRMEELCMSSPAICSPLTAITNKFQKIAVTKASPGKRSRDILERIGEFNEVWDRQMGELKRVMGEMRRHKQEFYEDCLAELQGKPGAGGLRVQTLRQNLQRSVKKYQV